MKNKLLTTKIIRNFSALAVVLFCLFLLYVTMNFYSADICYQSSRNLIDSRSYEKSLEKASCAIRKNPYEANYYAGRAKVLLLLGTENTMEAKVIAFKDLLSAKKINDHNLVVIRNMIPLYYFLGIKDFSKPSSADNLDAQFLPIIEEYYQDVKSQYYSDVGVISLVSRYEKKLDMDENYNESIEIIRRLRPDLLDWYVTW